MALVKAKVITGKFYRRDETGRLVRCQPGDVIEIDESNAGNYAKGSLEISVTAGKPKAAKAGGKKPAKETDMQMVTQVENGGKPATTNRHAILRKAAESVTGPVTPKAVNDKLPAGADPFTAAEIKRLGF